MLENSEISAQIQPLFVRLSNFTVSTDPLKHSELNENVYYWLFQVKRLCPSIFEKNTKSLQKFNRLLLDGLVYVSSQELALDRCALIMVEILKETPSMISIDQLLLGLNHIFNVKKKKNGKSGGIYFNWIKNGSKAMTASVAMVLWKLLEYGVDAWEGGKSLYYCCYGFRHLIT